MHGALSTTTLFLNGNYQEMKLSAKIRRIGLRIMVVATLLTGAACDSAIYDYEGDCSVTYRLRFRYDMNMKFADAFAQEVSSVNVCAFNSDGVLVWQKSDKGEQLKAEDYAMTLELPAGKYELVAWCGLENDGTREESFNVPQMQVGVSTREQLTCTLKRKHDAAGQAYTDTDLYGLYHGSINVEIIDEDAPEAVPGIHDVEMPLTKDTNHVRVILQNLSGQDLNAEDFSFTVEDNNGLMSHDNSLMNDEPITYRQWNTLTGAAGVANDETQPQDDDAITTVNVAVADLTVARMMTDHKMMLTIRNVKENKTVARIPLTDYALLVKENYGRKMSAQEYLDRQDEYALTFFLDENNQWLSAVIYINSWRVVLNDMEMD